MRDSWSDPSWSEPDRPPRGAAPRGRAGGDALEQGLDRLVSAGRQLVDGVSGARPGSRAGGRASSGRGAAPLPRLNDLGRWVETKLDWILEDDDDWREPWQEPPPERPRSGTSSSFASPAVPPRSRRQPLEAISRRGGRPIAPDLSPQAPDGPDGPQDWPDAGDLSLHRWQRPAPGRAVPAPAPQEPAPGGRPVPRSSRRRAP